MYDATPTTTTLPIIRRNGTTVHVLLDQEDHDKLIGLGFPLKLSLRGNGYPYLYLPRHLGYPTGATTLARFILDAKPRQRVRYINGNPLDLRRSNLCLDKGWSKVSAKAVASVSDNEKALKRIEAQRRRQALLTIDDDAEVDPEAHRLEVDADEIVWMPLKSRREVHYVKVEQEDYERLLKLGIKLTLTLNSTGYVYLNLPRSLGVATDQIPLARVILGADSGQKVCYRSKDKLDLTRGNIGLRKGYSKFAAIDGEDAPRRSELDM